MDHGQLIENMYRVHRKINSHTISGSPRSGMSYISQSKTINFSSKKSKLFLAINDVLKNNH
jgi:hypothetical protein